MDGAQGESVHQHTSTASPHRAPCPEPGGRGPGTREQREGHCWAWGDPAPEESAPRWCAPHSKAALAPPPPPRASRPQHHGAESPAAPGGRGGGAGWSGRGLPSSWGAEGIAGPAGAGSSSRGGGRRPHACPEQSCLLSHGVSEATGGDGRGARSCHHHRFGGSSATLLLNRVTSSRCTMGTSRMTSVRPSWSRGKTTTFSAGRSAWKLNQRRGLAGPRGRPRPGGGRGQAPPGPLGLGGSGLRCPVPLAPPGRGVEAQGGQPPRSRRAACRGRPPTCLGSRGSLAAGLTAVASGGPTARTPAGE